MYNVLELVHKTIFFLFLQIIPGTAPQIYVLASNHLIKISAKTAKKGTFICFGWGTTGIGMRGTLFGLDCSPQPQNYKRA